jgi:LuxR family maltose regulon positive regulatory protein
LAASYVKGSRIPSAWINLDKEDSDRFTLFQSIVQSLQYLLKDIDFAPLLSFPLSRVGTKAQIPLFRDWTRSLFELISSPLQLVLDGLEQLPHDSPVFKLLQILIEDAPPNIHWIMLSRELPPSPLEFQRLKIRQEAWVLTNEELAFTRGEIREFFQKIPKISFNADELEKIYLATEGWIGGLILLSETLSRFPEDFRGRYISEDLPDHFKSEVFEYFAQEIFSSQAEKVQDFLLKSSILDLIEPGFMNDFIGLENSEQILRGFVRRNLFVLAIHDEKKGWVFRYHQLFRKFLEVKFESEIRGEERQSLFSRAGYLYEKRGELENAAKYFLEAKAYPQAESVIERLGMNLLQRGRREYLSQCLSALPEEFIQKNPWLFFYLTMTRRFLVGRENVFALQEAYTLFKQKGDRKGHLVSLAQLIEASIYTGVHVVPIEGLVEEGETILQSLEMNEYPYEKAMLWYYLGFGHILGDGDIRKGILACQNAYLIAKQLKDLNLQAYALNFSALGYELVGEFSQANETCKKLEKIIEKSVFPELRALHLIVCCYLANQVGDFVQAQGLLEKLRMEIEKYGFVCISPWVYEISGYLSLFRGEFPEAEGIGKQYRIKSQLSG